MEFRRISILAASLIISMMAGAQTRETAVLFSGVEMDDSYLLTENVSVTFGSDGNVAIYAGETKVSDLDLTNTVTAEFKDAFKLKANQDQDNPANYYSTFFTSKSAYKVPDAAKAYAGVADDDVLLMTNIGGIIHQSEAVILRASQGDITLMPSCDKDVASEDNKLLGTDEPKTLGANEYALSLGHKGVGFYLWSGKTIGANKAYLSLDGSDVKTFTFEFDDGPATAISRPAGQADDTPAYNLSGVRVDDNYKGIVIKNGKKCYNNK